MTPRQRAEFLVSKFYGTTPMDCWVEIPSKYMIGEFFNGYDSWNQSKQCALIAVDEILDMDYPHSDFQDLELHVSYWEKVKKEIEKL